MANSSLLDEPTIRERVWRFSVEQYHFLGQSQQIGENVELLEGTIVKKMPKSPRHEFFTAALAEMLAQVAPPEFFVRKEAPITCADSEPEPDVAVVRGQRSRFLDVHPTTASLVIEVALTSADTDNRKRKIYAAAEVTEYWIVFPEEKRVEVYTRPYAGDYQASRSYSKANTIRSEVLPAFQLDLATFFPE